MNDFNKVGVMHEHFGLPFTDSGTIPKMIDKETAKFRLEFLREELAELSKGYADQDLEQVADALVDIVVVALGTAQMHGLPWDDLFDEVMDANMKKIRVTFIKQSKRLSVLDLMKPKGWTPPNIYGVLKAHGLSKWFQSDLGLDLDAPRKTPPDVI